MQLWEPEEWAVDDDALGWLWALSLQLSSVCVGESILVAALATAWLGPRPQEWMC